MAETRRDAFDAIEHNDAQATRASSSASRPNDARTSTSSCASRRLSSLHRAFVDAIDADKHKKKHRRRVLTPRTPSRDSLDEAAETSPRPRADWTPRRRLKFYGRRLADDSLSDNQIRRLREGLLGEYGLNWRRDRERDVAAALAKAASDLREGAMGEIWRSGRAGRPTRRHVLARLLHAVSVIAAPDPALVTPSRVERVARGLASASTRDLLLLSRWASSEFV